MPSELWSGVDGESNGATRLAEESLREGIFREKQPRAATSISSASRHQRGCRSGCALIPHGRRGLTTLQSKRSRGFCQLPHVHGERSDRQFRQRTGQLDPRALCRPCRPLKLPLTRPCPHLNFLGLESDASAPILKVNPNPARKYPSSRAPASCKSRHLSRGR